VARTTQHRKHHFPYGCRGVEVLPLSCLANSLGADHIEYTSSAVRTLVYWSVAQHWAWRGPHRKHFFQYPFYCCVCIFWALPRNGSIDHSIILSSSILCDITFCSTSKVDFQRITWCYMPEDRTLINHCCENLKSGNCFNSTIPRVQ
jgi:hypothetical protein